jgi:5-methylcytosine-specific restriction endonuclease McrA
MCAAYQAHYRPRYRQSEHGRAVKGKANAWRRARQVNAIVLERVDRRTIFVLDGGLCHLCDLPVDPQAFHIDHVVPLAVEPIEAEFNCAVAHPMCNVRKPRRHGKFELSVTARARWQERRPEHLALLDQHLARLAA